MKKNWKFVEMTWGIAAFLFLFSACGSKKTDSPAQGNMPPAHDQAAMQHDTAAVYTCPMHPEIVRNEPGQCPICKMDLKKKETPPPT